jgi:hypothetical protein
MFGFGKRAVRELTEHQVAAWLAKHATEKRLSRQQCWVYYQASVLLETEDAEHRAFVDDVLGQ